MPDGTVSIASAEVSAVVRPELGGGLARFDHVAVGGREPLFRPEPEGGAKNPFELASNVLVPWSNRISGGGFSFRGTRHDLEPNLMGEPYPIHGNGFSAAWQVVDRGAQHVSLALQSDGPGPYRYAAALEYRVAGRTLGMSLAVENRCVSALPFGLGFHPWLVREPGTLLQAPAREVWLEDERHLPLGDRPAPIPADWDFRLPKELPDGFINNGFAGWNGRAAVTWTGRKLRLEIEADPLLSTYIVYSPSAGADFFCFEPVSHPVDAFNLPGGAEKHGLVALGAGETLRTEARFTVSRTT